MKTRIINRFAKTAFAAILLLNLPLTARAIDARCGGDGPKPFLESPSGEFPTTIPTRASVEQFNYLEKTDSVVYRDERNGLRIANAAGDFSTGHTAPPLDRVTDPMERVLLAQGVGHLFDLAQPKYGWVEFYGETMHHIFWQHDNLYSVASHRGLLGRKFIDVYQLPRNSYKAKATCTFQVGLNETLYLAQGHNYPNIYFYEVDQRDSRHFLRFITYDVEQCAFKPELSFKEAFTSPIQAVYHFDNLNSTAVKVDHPTENLFWQTGPDCRYFNIGNQQPIFPDSKRPYLFTWANSKLMLYSLNGQRKTELLSNFPMPIENIRTRDIWLNSQGTELLVAAKIQGQTQRKILKLKVDLK